MTVFYTNVNGNQWSGLVFSVDYICDNCNSKVKRAQVQWEDCVIHDKFNYCPYCGKSVPKEFPIYINNTWKYPEEE